MKRSKILCTYNARYVCAQSGPFKISYSQTKVLSNGLHGNVRNLQKNQSTRNDLSERNLLIAEEIMEGR